jgi:xanthine dehydrogenase YagR molybdenum-binding subunit
MEIAPFLTNKRGGHVGLSTPRADGEAKVRGAARYAAEHNPDGVLYGFAVPSVVASGRITGIDVAAAASVPGVVTVLTYENAAEQAPLVISADIFTNVSGAKPQLDGDAILFHGQFVALVVAESYEAARAAAALVRVQVADEHEMRDFDAALADAYTPQSVNGGAVADTAEGDVEGALGSAAVVVDATYDTPFEHNNAMEPHAAVAEWRDGRLEVQDTNQGVSLCAMSLAATFRLRPDQVRVRSRFIGGGFGAKFALHPHVVLAALGAKATGRPVKVALTRQQVFTDHGHRTRTRQRLRLGAGKDGRLTALSHQSWLQCSMHEEFVEQAGVMSRIMYAAPNRVTRHYVTRMHTPTPSWMRAPGEAPGSFALESAMDELAHALGIDPIELRRVNEPAVDPESGKPWSSRSLLACFDQGAARFGWETRTAPGIRREGRWQVGLGVASATYPARTLPASCAIKIDWAGRAVVRIAAADLGTGAYTVLRQIAADALGLADEAITVEIGDSDLPMAFGAGGSSGMASFGSALVGAAAVLRDQLAERARGDDRSPLRGVNSDRLILANGRLELIDEPGRGEDLNALLARVAPAGISADYSHGPAQNGGYASHAFGAQFAEVGVDSDSGEIRLRRLLGVFGVGRVLNPRTAASQFIGGMTMGVGQALMEETLLDHRWGQWVNRDLAEYHVPVHADVPVIESFTVDEHDPHVNVLGAKGIGEIGIVGVAAAIANAVFNATGVRLRDLPLTLDKLWDAGWQG